MIINLRLFSEIFSECPTCLLRSLLSGLSRSLTNPSPAQLLVSSFSPQSCSSYSTLGSEESHLEHVESMDRPRVLKEFPLSLYPIPLVSFSLKPWSTNSRHFVIPNLTFCLLSLKKKTQKTEVVYILHPRVRTSPWQKARVNVGLTSYMFFLSKIKTPQFHLTSARKPLPHVFVQFYHSFHQEVMYDTSFSDFQDVDTGSFKNRNISCKKHISSLS